MGRVCGDDLEVLRECLPLPDSNKFNWTISGYACDPDTLESAKDHLAQVLKEAELGKARFIRPVPYGEETEVRLYDLIKNILSEEKGKRISGVDLIVDCSDGDIQYAYTEYLSDVTGFRVRDLNRPYQDPTVTLGPRLARTLVNLCGLPRGKTILDPFCGLGTVLQEGLLTGANVVGIDISSTAVARCRENLEWLARRFDVSSKLFSKVVRGDSLDLASVNLPHVDAVATEPILMPKLENNPSREKAIEIVQKVSEKYHAAFRTFTLFLGPGSPVSIVAPELIDDRGRPHAVDLNKIAPNFGFVLERPNPTIENPCSVPTTKKKTIRRQIYLWRFLPKAS